MSLHAQICKYFGTEGVPYIFFRRRRNGTSQMQRKGIYDGATPLYPYITFVDEHFDG